MKISVKAIPIDEIMEDFSKQFGLAIEKDSGEQTLNLPQQIGEGFIRGTSFNSGIGIISFQCTFSTDMEIHFTKNKTHPLKFVFCSEGRIEHSFEKDDARHTIDRYQNIIVSSSGHNGHILFFKANETAHVTSLEIIRNIFSDRGNHGFKHLTPELKKVFKDGDAKDNFYYQGNYSMKTADIVEEITNKEFSGFLRSVFLEGKSLEMLALQIAQYLDDQREDKLPQILRRSDIEKVHSAIELIQQNLHKNYSVDFLAKEVGTNVNKLQEGFKYMYNMTVNKYVQYKKLEAAKEMLGNTEYNVSQIVGLIGLNNRSYFSKIFKEKYGVSPKYFRKSNSEKDED